MKRLILASASPRRKEILQQIGIDFDILPSDYDESSFDFSGDIRAASAELALLKARAAAAHISGEAVVIGADTVVVLDGRIFGKPSSEQDARIMLQALGGRVHQVVTGIAAVDALTGRSISQAEITDVYFRDLTEADIEKYISTGEYADKAGAYAIQGFGALLVRKIDGCYYNVVGLPVSGLIDMLKIFEENGDTNV